MDVVVEALTPTRTKIALTFSPADVDAAIAKAVNATRRDLSLPGFRKGKVPPAVVERRYGDEITSRATEDTINSTIREVLEREGLEPLSRIDLDAPGRFARTEGFTCSLSFDVLPAIEFPAYEGLPVEQTRVAVSESEVDEILARVRGNFATLKDVEASRLPADGDMVDVDYEGFENGEPVKDVSGKHFMLALGEKQALPDFEALVKTLLPGETKEGVVNFPADYGHKELAGKAVTMRVTLNAIKERELPELDDELAKKTGHESVEKLREAISKHSTEDRTRAAKGAAMKTLLEGLLAKVEFALPENMVETRVRRLADEKAEPLRREGKTPPEPTEEERAALRTAAEEAVRPEVFLMALAKREKLTVSEQELALHIYSMASRAGQDYQKVSEFYHRTGLIHELRDRILADKAMEFVYGKATITEVDAPKNA